MVAEDKIVEDKCTEFFLQHARFKGAVKGGIATIKNKGNVGTVYIILLLYGHVIIIVISSHDSSVLLSSHITMS